MNITEFREKYPEYNHVDDETLARTLHEKNYSHVSYEQFAEVFMPQEAVGVVQPETQQYQSESEIPIAGEENLPFAPKEQQPVASHPDPRRQLVKDIIGGAEGAATMATGMGSSAVAGIVGSAYAANPLSEPGEGARVAQQIQEAGTYQPRTEAGQQAIQGAADFMQPYEEFKQSEGEEVLRETGSPLLATAAHMLPDAIGALFGLKTAQPKAIKTPKLKGARPYVKNKPALKALGNDFESAKLVNLTERMSAATKRGVNKMLDKIMKERTGHGTERATDVVGEAVHNRAKEIFRLNKEASNKVGAIANKNKTVVDITVAKQKFFQALDDMGVTFKQGEDGWVTPDFSRSKFIGGSQKDMTVLINDLLKDKITFDLAHNTKQFIRKNIDYDKFGAGKMDYDSSTIMSDLSRGINDVLKSKSKAYGVANGKYAKTIDMKNELQKLVGKDMDLFDDAFSVGIFGDKVKRLTSNAVSRNAIGKTMVDLDKILKNDFRITYKDSIMDLSFAADHLNRIFKIAPPNSLKGIGTEIASGVAQGESAGRLAVRVAPRVFSKHEQTIFNKDLATLRDLVKVKQ